MAVTVIVGGQYGSEGKGKMTSYLALHDDADAVVRCGGPNAGHTVDYQGNRFVARQVPCGYINPRTRLYLAAGAIVDPELLLQEVQALGLADRIFVDRNAAILDDHSRKIEVDLQLRKRLASTLSGTGGATSLKVLRSPDLTLAGQSTAIPREWVVDVAAELNELEVAGGRILVEGTQGFGLSLHHGDEYPYRTSRDTTAAGFLSEVGLSPMVVTDIVMVVRTFPIRVGGHSGPLPAEITWDQLQVMSGYGVPIREYTSVSGTERRVANFDMALVKRAAKVNRPTALAIHGLDYLSRSDLGKMRFTLLSEISQNFVKSLEEDTGTFCRFLFTGPPTECTIDRMRQEQLLCDLVPQVALRHG